MKRLNALFCSTCSWNPGIEWIELGARNLFRRLCGIPGLEWRVHESARSSVRPASAREAPQPPHQGNSVTHADVVVAAGTPEWSGSQFRVLLDLREAGKFTWLFLGVDHSEKDLRLTPAECAALSGATMLTRSPFAYNALKDVGFESRLLPCPSLFASEWEDPPRRFGSLAVVWEADCAFHGRQPPWLGRAMQRSIAQLRQEYEVHLLYRSIAQSLEMAADWPRDRLYCPDSSALLSSMSQCDVIATNSVHAAFAAASLLKPAILVTGDAQPSSAAALFPYLPSSSPGELLDHLRRIDIEALPRSLLNWKRDVETQYLEILSAWIHNHGFHLV
ncbi:MAG: polysaccharide pyruvyl transferase family protein [Acidobacteriaceae bacterium]|nr:polysaccharide pyruvyl transferase family protein [Acidobacteriaceae bacterium]